MDYLKIILLFIFGIGIESKKCEIGFKGIFCEYPHSPGKNCDDFKGRTLTTEEKTFIVEEHNRLRHQIATGNGTSLPKAYFMRKILWDKELGDAAQRWADQCGESLNDDERDKFLIGANVGIGVRSGKNDDLLKLISKWKLGLSDISESLVREFQPQEKENVKESSQMIWAKTDKIGCGVSEYKGRCKQTMHKTCPLMELVCFYSPAGNVKGESIYSVFDDKNFNCVKKSSEALCDKINYNGGNGENILLQSHREAKMKSELDLLTPTSHEDYHLDMRKRKTVPPENANITDAKSKCVVTPPAAGDPDYEPCKKKVKEIREYMNFCNGKPKGDEGNDPGTAEEKAIKALFDKCEKIAAQKDEAACTEALNNINPLYEAATKSAICKAAQQAGDSTKSLANFTKSSLIMIFISLATYLFVC